MPSMKSCGFDMELVSPFMREEAEMLTGQAQDFIDPFLDILRSFKAKDTADRPSEYSLIQLLQDPERSNSIVVVSSYFPPSLPSLTSFLHGGPTDHLRLTVRLSVLSLPPTSAPTPTNSPPSCSTP